MIQERVPLHDLARDLGRRAEALVRWLGLQGQPKGHDFWALNPTRGDRHVGSFRVCLTGDKAGLWQDHATGEGGDALDLLAYIRRLPLREAITEARGFLGVDDAAIPGPRIVPEGPPPADAAARRNAALKIWLAAKTLAPGDPVVSYLAGRGIDLTSMGRAPRALRFHPALFNREVNAHLPAMVAAVTLGGSHCATHRTWLAQDGGRWRKAKLEKAKMVYGPMAGGHIALWRGASGKALRDAPAGETVAIAEGIETALSVAVACPELRVLAGVSVTNLGHLVLPEAVTDVILAADNDAGRTDAQLHQAAERYLAEGRRVRIAMTAVAEADWNDILLGVNA